MPSRYSKNAPPAVETKLNFLLMFSELMTATVSPPPTTEKILSPLLAIYFAISELPNEKFIFSK